MGNLLIMKNVGVRLPDGVDKNKFLGNTPVASAPEDVLNLLKDHGYNVKEVPGAFVKGFTMNPKEIHDFEIALNLIDEKGLNPIVASNLRLTHFKTSFLNRVLRCIESGLPYLNSDNTFIKELYSTEATNKYLESRPTVVETPVVETVAPTNISTPNEETSNIEATIESKMESMDEFDKHLLYDMIEKLNFLVLNNVTNETLANIVSAIPVPLADAIARHEYQFIGTNGMLNNILESLGVNIESNEAEMIRNAIPEISSGRGRAA